MSDLKPCPHCGSDEVSTNYTLISESHWAYCDSCGMRGPVAATAELARLAWNALPRARWVSLKNPNDGYHLYGSPDQPEPRHIPRDAVLRARPVMSRMGYMQLEDVPEFPAKDKGKEDD